MSIGGNGNFYITKIVIVTGGFPKVANPELTINDGDVTKTGFTVSWNLVDNAGRYEVKLDGGEAESILTGSSKAFTGLEPGTKHTIEVRAISGDANIDDSDWVSSEVTTLPATPLATPSISSTATITKNSIVITWGTVANADSYDVEVLKAGSRVVLAEGVTDTSYTATDLYAGTEHTFKVKANTGGNEYTDSEWASAAFSTEEDTSAPEWTVSTVPTFQPKVPGSFTINAVKSGVPLVVEFKSITPRPTSEPTFDGTTFSWTPAYADADEAYSIVFSAEGTESKNEVRVTLAPLPEVVWSVGELPAFQETFEASFNVGATISGVAQGVRLESFAADSGDMAGDAPTFDGTTFTWNPAIGNAKSFTATFAISAHDTTYTKDVKFSVTAHPIPVWSIDGATTFDVKKEGTCTIGFDTQNPAVSASKITVEFDNTPETPYTFNGGVFTWTPVYDDRDQDFAVTFRANAYGQSYTHHVTFHVNTVIGHETIFEENFSDKQFSSAWTSTNSMNAAGAPSPDNDGWSFDDAVCAAYSGIRLSAGITDKAEIGVATTPAIKLSNSEKTAEVSVSFHSVFYTTGSTPSSSISIGVINPDTGAANWLEKELDTNHRIKNKILIDSNEYAFVVGNIVVPDGFKLAFKPTDGCFPSVCLDAITIKQEVRTDFGKFDAPANVILAAGEDATTQINVSWAAVDGASAYSLRYVDPDGNETVVKDIAATQYVIDNLTHNTEYAVSVMTLGLGNIATPNGMYESDWSEPVEHKTAIAEDKVVITIPEELPEFTELQEGSFEVSAKLGQDYVTTFTTTRGEIVEDNGSYILKYMPPRTGAAADTAYTVSGTITAMAGSKTATEDFEITVHALPALEPLTLAAATDVTENSAKLTWSGVGQARLDGDVKVRVWYGSCNMASTTTDEESFYNIVRVDTNSVVAEPSGWYRDAGVAVVQGAVWPWQMKTSGTNIVSKFYRKPLTSYKFQLKHGVQGSYTDTKVRIYGSRDLSINGDDVYAMNWEPVLVQHDEEGAEAKYELGVDDFVKKGSAFSLKLNGDGSEGYHFIRWEFVNPKGTMALGCVYAEYAGACAKFKRGTLEEAESLGTSATSLDLTGLPAGREFFVELTAVGLFGEEVKTYTRFSTVPASTGTLLIVK